MLPNFSSSFLKPPQVASCCLKFPHVASQRECADSIAVPLFGWKYDLYRWEIQLVTKNRKCNWFLKMRNTTGHQRHLALCCLSVKGRVRLAHALSYANLNQGLEQRRAKKKSEGRVCSWWQKKRRQNYILIRRRPKILFGKMIFRPKLLVGKMRRRMRRDKITPWCVVGQSVCLAKWGGVEGGNMCVETLASPIRECGLAAGCSTSSNHEM